MDAQWNHHPGVLHSEVVGEFSGGRTIAALVCSEILEQHPLDI